MKNWISRWFGAAPEPAATPIPASAAAPALEPAGEDEAAAGNAVFPAPAEIDYAFFRQLVAADAVMDEAPAGAEKLILDELARLAQSPTGGANLVPRVPAVIPQLLKSLRDESVSGADLARQIAQDVVLVAEVIREANSPYYHPPAPVKTIEGAVRLLGQNGLRLLLARVAFRPIISMQAGRFAKVIAPQLWRQSEKCALAANMLAPALLANPFEAYLAGLMHNVGLIVAFRSIDQIYHAEALPQTPAFCHALIAVARLLSGRIAGAWEFPAPVIEAILHMGESSEAGTLPLAQALAQGDQLSKLRMLVDGGQLEPVELSGLTLRCYDKLADPG